MNLRVLSYNVLSSHLAEPSHYPTLDPDHLRAENRLPIVLKKLEWAMAQHSFESSGTSSHNNQNQNQKDATADNPGIIICLQEISYDWAGPLHTFFANKGYHFVTGLYGKKFNGYMGVGLAWSTQDFETLDVDMCRLADTRTEGWPKAYAPPTVWTRVLQGVSSFLQDRVKQWKQWKLLTNTHNTNKDNLGYEEDPPDHWSLSERRFNVLVTATLREKMSGQAFAIGTYHMPCAYYCPMAMTLHADLCAHRVQSIALKNGGVPCILAGDFNIKPSEPVYQFMTTGELPVGSPFYPSPKNEMNWVPTMACMQSAYAAKQGHEPDFTNYAQSGDSTEPFIETLDYIFLSPEWKVDSVLEIPDRKENVQGPFPNLDVNEPSDHVMIAALVSCGKDASLSE